MCWDMIEKHVEAGESEQSNLFCGGTWLENTLWLAESEQSNLSYLEGNMTIPPTHATMISKSALKACRLYSVALEVWYPVREMNVWLWIGLLNGWVPGWEDGYGTGAVKGLLDDCEQSWQDGWLDDCELGWDDGCDEGRVED